jgi:hypothetical protein
LTGAVFCSLARLLYVTLVTSQTRPAAIKLTWILTIAGPAFVIALLFMSNWLKRGELRAFVH